MEYRHKRGSTSYEEALESWDCADNPNIIVIYDPENYRLRDAWGAGMVGGLGDFIRDETRFVVWYPASRQLFVKMVP